MTYYYLIRPNADLQALLAQNPRVTIRPIVSLAEDVGLPTYTIPDHIEQRKLLYMASLVHHMEVLKDSILDSLPDFISTKEDRLLEAQLYQMILGDPPYTRQLFDRWWTIEKILHTFDYDRSLEQLSLSVLQTFEETDSRLAAWLKRVKALKNKSE